MSPSLQHLSISSSQTLVTFSSSFHLVPSTFLNIFPFSILRSPQYLSLQLVSSSLQHLSTSAPLPTWILSLYTHLLSALHIPHSTFISLRAETINSGVIIFVFLLHFLCSLFPSRPLTSLPPFPLASSPLPSPPLPFLSQLLQVLIAVFFSFTSSSFILFNPLSPYFISRLHNSFFTICFLLLCIYLCRIQDFFFHYRSIHQNKCLFLCVSKTALNLFHLHCVIRTKVFMSLMII